MTDFQRSWTISSAIQKALENGWVTHKAELRGKGYDFHYGIDSSPERFIYDKGFAEALWGGNWKKHLDKMVRSEDKIKYIKENL